MHFICSCRTNSVVFARWPMLACFEDLNSKMSVQNKDLILNTILNHREAISAKIYVKTCDSQHKTIDNLYRYPDFIMCGWTCSWSIWHKHLSRSGHSDLPNKQVADICLRHPLKTFTTTWAHLIAVRNQMSFLTSSHGEKYSHCLNSYNFQMCIDILPNLFLDI